MINLSTHVPGTQRYWLCISLHPVTQTLLFFCTHPWQLVAKSCGRLSRLVTDASVLTRYSYGHCSESPVLAMFLHFLSQHGQGLCHL